MKVAVIGSRGFADYELMKLYLDRLHATKPISLIVSGGATGADSFGAQWADENTVQKLIFKAEWDDLTHPDTRIRTNKFGKQYDANAGFRRNKDIIDNSDIVVAFWDMKSPGTKNSIQYAESLGKKIAVIKYE